MRLRKISSVQLSLPFLILQVLWLIPVFAKDKPTITENKLDGFPNGLFYFDDSNTIVLLHRKSRTVQISMDGGEKWETVDDIEKGHAWDILPHPFDKNVAYILGGDTKHWVTKDQGKKWKLFETESPPFGRPMSFHASDPNKVIMHLLRCRSFIDCDESDFYTTDGFESKPILLRNDTKNCVFADSSPQFKENGDGHPEDRIICIVLGQNSPWPKDHRIVVSDKFFENKDEKEPYLDGGRTVRGIIKMAVVKGFILAAAKAENTAELALYVTRDAKNWHRAEFPSEHRLVEDAYTILESTNYSIQVDVMTIPPPSPMGVLFTSNSNGTYFTENIKHTNRNKFGNVDFEKIQGIQGIVLVNIVDNWQEVEEQARLGRGSDSDKRVQTQISFDDGRTFKPIKFKDEDLHLHSISDISNFGKVYSSPAPGIVMGVGNTGKHLKPYREGNLYVSDDAGLSWTKARDEAHKYEFGGQGGVLAAIYDEGLTDKIIYSIDHGKNWKEEDLGRKVVAKVLTTTPDSTSLKFLLIATAGEGHNLENYVYAIDFEGLHERKCGDGDFELWHARLNEKKEPDCLMGRKQSYRRRKADANCFVGNKQFEEPQPIWEKCTCTEEDFECDFNFVKSDDGKKCTLSGMLPIPEGECENSGDKFRGTSGYRLIPGNQCKREHGVEMDKEKDWPCQDSIKKPVSGKISSEIKSFSGDEFREFYYLERALTSTGKDQTVVMRTDANEIWLTKNHGKTWKQILKDDNITAIYPHQYHNDEVYFLTAGSKVHYTMNRGQSFGEFDAPPGGPTHNERLQVLGFHTHSNWLIWTGADGCSGGSETECHDVAHVSDDRGAHWRAMLRYVRKCEFIKEEGRRSASDKLVYCEQYENEKLDSPLQLVSSEDFFSTEPKVRFKNIVDFATMSEFIIVAAKDNDYLKVDASVDGKIFADALFPPNFKVLHQKAYTVLDSSTHAVFLHVTVQTRPGGEYGSIVKSNSNGTSYVLSLDGVNRDAAGYVDFEKMLGLQGVALVNVVDNIKEVEDGQNKKLKTMITHNDGAEWSRIKAPQLDSQGAGYDCDIKDIAKCSLHLHAYTERKDPRDTYSSVSAIGLMMGVGNVGQYLGAKSEGDTFITRDGGIEWHAVRKGSYMWEYGNQGSIIVIVEENKATKLVYYTHDEGRTWKYYQFSEADMIIRSISSVPSDSSREFLLWGKEVGGSNKIATVNLDFTGLTDRKCELDEDHPTDGDYELWTPTHPMQENDCLFGQVTQYYRKKITSDCYNDENVQKVHNITRKCACTRQDFEWYVFHSEAFAALIVNPSCSDYNYELLPGSTCRLIDNLPPPDHSQQCKDNPEQVSYFEPSGYRKVPISACEGGRELEFSTTEKPCPNHRKEFEEMHRGLSGFWLFVVAFLFPVIIASAVGYWVWNNWGRQFGQIRLGGDSGSGSTFDTNKPWISYPIMVVSGIVAVVAAVPMLVGSLWTWASGKWGGGSRGRYTTRGSFARGRGDYAVVDPDEDELLGVDDDDEV